MASAPQNVTRNAPNFTLAPPTRAARPPSSARKISDVTETTAMNCACGMKAAVSNGKAAPTAITTA